LKSRNQSAIGTPYAQVFEVTQASDGCRKRTTQVLVVGEVPAKIRRQSPHMLATMLKFQFMCLFGDSYQNYKRQEVSYKVCNSDRDWMSPDRDPDNPKLESLLQKQPP
jgi:hypothetical protein